MRALPDLGDGGEDGAARHLLLVGHAREGDGRLVQHRIGDGLGLADGGAESDAGEDVHVVALRRRLDRAVGESDGLEGRAGRHDGAAVRPFIRLLGRDLAGGGRVRERHHDRPLDGGRHLADRSLGDGASLAREAEDEVRLRLLDHLLERHPVGQVGAREGHLLLGERREARLGLQPVLVEDVKVAVRRLGRQPRLLHRHVQRLGHADPGGASADHGHPQRADVLGRPPLQPQRAEHACEDGGAGALDVVVEATNGPGSS
mmetsp:Transcript_7497/g.24686  ORF Transcript_7497/g.24686 Transcript_7497/m.24686 type:complete len:260 (+) Transcript_7497:346-1125(+)